MKLFGLIILAIVIVFFTAPALAAGTTQVQMKDFKFQPDHITIKSGDTVTWTNMDSAPHDVKFKDFESKNLNKGEQYSKTFDKPGTYDYICEIHPYMKGQVVVQ